MKRAIVTGATGFIGKWLVKELSKSGYDVTAVVRNLQKVPSEWKDKIEVVECNIENYPNMPGDSFRCNDYNLFFHLAWEGGTGFNRANYAMQLKNVYAACEALKLSKRLGCQRFVNAGSIMEYEALQYIQQDGAVPTAGYIYSTAKLTADFMLKSLAAQEDIEYINVIISNVYGVGETSARFLNQLLRKMIANQRIALTSGEQLYDFIYVTDAVKGMICAAQKGKKNFAYYIGNHTPHPLKTYILQIKEILDSNAELVFGEVPFNGVMLSYKEFDTSKLYDLGYNIEIPFQEGVLMTTEWIRGENSSYGF